MSAVSAKREREEERTREILERLEEHYPDATCALHHENPFQLLVATILSAQCTDEQVNKVTPELFARFPDPQKLSRADLEDLQEIIRSTGFFRNKAASLKGASRVIVENFGGEVPNRMKDLLALPGVARKTANVVLGTAYGQAEGVVVDTHVRRLSQRLGFTRDSQPEKIERSLMEKIPQSQWIDLSHRLIFHGRRVCRAQKPHCSKCFLTDLCPWYQDHYRTS